MPWLIVVAIGILVIWFISWVLIETYRWVDQSITNITRLHVNNEQVISCFDTYWPQEWRELLRTGATSCLVEFMPNNFTLGLNALWDWASVEGRWVWIIWGFGALLIGLIIADSKQQRKQKRRDKLEELISEVMIIGMAWVTYLITTPFGLNTAGCCIDGLLIDGFINRVSYIVDCSKGNIPLLPPYLQAWWVWIGITVVAWFVLEIFIEGSKESPK